jgi:hypothetical protein
MAFISGGTCRSKAGSTVSARLEPAFGIRDHTTCVKPGGCWKSGVRQKSGESPFQPGPTWTLERKPPVPLPG